MHTVNKLYFLIFFVFIWQVMPLMDYCFHRLTTMDTFARLLNSCMSLQGWPIREADSGWLWRQDCPLTWQDEAAQHQRPFIRRWVPFQVDFMSKILQRSIYNCDWYFCIRIDVDGVPRWHNRVERIPLRHSPNRNDPGLIPACIPLLHVLPSISHTFRSISIYH